MIVTLLNEAFSAKWRQQLATPPLAIKYRTAGCSTAFFPPRAPKKSSGTAVSGVLSDPRLRGHFLLAGTRARRPACHRLIRQLQNAGKVWARGGCLAFRVTAEEIWKMSAGVLEFNSTYRYFCGALDFDGLEADLKVRVGQR